MTFVSTITIVGVTIMSGKVKRAYQEWVLGKTQVIGSREFTAA